MSPLPQLEPAVVFVPGEGLAHAGFEGEVGGEVEVAVGFVDGAGPVGEEEVGDFAAGHDLGFAGEGPLQLAELACENRYEFREM